MIKYLALLLMLLPLSGWAQDIVLWKATNTNSSTLVPAYMGQSSPFPHITQVVNNTSGTLDAEAEAARLARLQALERAEQLLAGKEAFKPEVGLIRIDGRVEGAAGPKILISNQWVGVGRQLQVRLSRTAEADAALEELRKYDSDAASQLETKLDMRLQQSPYLSLTIDTIKAKEVQLHSSYGTHIIPIGQAQDY